MYEVTKEIMCKRRELILCKKHGREESAASFI